MESEGIVENAARIGQDVLGPGLSELTSNPLVGEVRGLGVFWAVELVADKQTRTPAAASIMGKVKAGCVARGLAPLIVENRIHVAPPCIITDDETRQGVAILAEVLDEVAATV
jgi:taurine--2-oxoglutarate transaminase